VFDLSAMEEDERDLIDRIYELPDAEADPIVPKAILAIESEFSPYDYGHRIREYGKELSFTLKDEDLQPLRRWVETFGGVQLGLVQVYLDSAFYLSFATLSAGIADGTIKRQRERAYNKDVYYPSMSKGIPFASFTHRPVVAADILLDKYGKYTPFRKVTGGLLSLSGEMREVLRDLHGL
jgi:hypothetical protein